MELVPGERQDKSRGVFFVVETGGQALTATGLCGNFEAQGLGLSNLLAMGAFSSPA
jgi:hypothetical protein